MKPSEQFHFQGIFVPASIIYRILAREICETDFLFMVLVRGLTEKSGKGCYAENNYFARSLRVVESRIPQIIRKLIELELLKKYQRNAVRYLETTWENTEQNSTGDITRLQGGYNRVIGQGYNPVIAPTIDEEEEMKTHKLSHQKNGATESGGFYQFENDICTTLREAVHRFAPEYAKTWTKHSLGHWPAEITRLKQDYSEEVIITTMEHHVEAMKSRDVFEPEAYCAKTFRVKFAKILKAKERKENTRNGKFVPRRSDDDVIS